MENIICVENVNKSYKGNQVLQNINISFETGKIHGIIGRNGSGKTVLIKTICGFVHPDTGRVLVDGKIIGKDIDFPKNIGAIIEAPGFLPNASAYKNLEYLASLRRVIGKEEIRKAIEIVGLNPDDKKHVGKYSLGMKQRLGLAQAIMENPDILILDDSASALDYATDAALRKSIREMKDAPTLFIVSQRAASLMHADRIIVLDDGNVAGIGTHEELLAANGVYTHMWNEYNRSVNWQVGKTGAAQ